MERKGVWCIVWFLVLSCLCVMAPGKAAAMGSMGTGLDGPVIAEFVDRNEVFELSVTVTDTTQFVITDSVVITGTSPVSGRVKSLVAGCRVPSFTCPFSERAFINCGYPPVPGDVCSAYFKGGSIVTLKPIAQNAETVFTGWMDDEFFIPIRAALKAAAQGGEPAVGGFIVPQPWFESSMFTLDNLRIVMPGDTDVLAFFTPKGTTWRLAAAPEGAGDLTGATVRSTPAGINCAWSSGGPTGSCEYDFPAGSYVRLNWTAPFTKKFLMWRSFVSTWIDMMMVYERTTQPFEKCYGPTGCVVPMSFPLFGLTRIPIFID